MAGSPTERGKHTPVLGRLGDKEWWFGNGRKFGIQRGSLEQRLTDPFYKGTATEVVKRYWLTRNQRVSDEQFRTGARLLAEQVNAGRADTLLIPTLESALASLNYDEDSFNDLLANPSSIYYPYEAVVASAHTVESIPYLLQALNSSFFIRDAESPIKSEPVLVEERSERHTEEGDVGPGGGIPQYGSWTVEEVYGIYTQESLYKIVGVPFAELAKKRLEDVVTSLDDIRMIEQIRKALTNFDEQKPKEITLPISFSRHIETRDGRPPPPRVTSYYG